MFATVVDPPPTLTTVNLQTTTLYGGRTAKLSLHIVVVGCGLGGLAAAHALAKAGHRITILEDAPAIGEVGAGNEDAQYGRARAGCGEVEGVWGVCWCRRRRCYRVDIVGVVIRRG